MGFWCSEYGVEIWAYCLMPNHVHLVAVPREKDSLNRAIGEVHRRYTRMINFREGWRGHLWQGRFASYVMDENYLLACVRYVENNPVRAKLSDQAGGWQWSSANAHITGKNDGLVTVKPLLDLVKKEWAEFLNMAVPDNEISDMRKHERTGRPLCSFRFLECRIGLSFNHWVTVSYRNCPTNENFFEEHHLFGAPVVGAGNRLLGVVLPQDIEEAVNKRKTKNFLRLSGIIGGEEFRTMPLLFGHCQSNGYSGFAKS